MAVRAKDFDCTRCGICCMDWNVKGDGTYIDLTSDDFERIPVEICGLVLVEDTPGLYSTKLVLRKTQAGPLYGAYIRRCAAFTGGFLHRCSCSIHDFKPSICRDFVPGNEKCVTMRKIIQGTIGIKGANGKYPYPCHMPKDPFHWHLKPPRPTPPSYLESTF